LLSIFSIIASSCTAVRSEPPRVCRRLGRQTEGLLGSVMDLLDLELPVPDHTTFSRRGADLGVATALRKASGPVHVVIDSTGLKVFGSGEWLHEKHCGKPLEAGESSTWP
jgi:hypothetical protein